MLNWLPSLFYAASAVSSARDIKKEGAYKAGIYRTNADLSRMQASDAMARGASEAMRARAKAKSMVGSQRAALAAQGVDISSGSALDVQVETGQLAEIDIMMIKNNAAREAWGYNAKASDHERQATLTEMEAKNAARTTLITGGMNALRFWG